MTRLTRAGHRAAIETLAAEDADLAAIVARHGPPTFRTRPAGFPTLLYIILEQQVSLASAKATYDKVLALVETLTPATYLALGDDTLRAAGLSRQKLRYTRLVAEAIEAGALPIDRLQRKTDDEVRTLLTAITGVGRWTADCYLMLALRRPDLWPVGDLALVKAVQAVKGLAERPDVDRLEAWESATGRTGAWRRSCTGTTT